MIVSRTYNTIPGTNILFHPSLNGVRIHSVDRTGMGQDRTIPFTAVNTQFYYFGSKLFFDNSIPFNVGEKVQVIYET